MKKIFTIGNIERFLRFSIDVIHSWRSYFDVENLKLEGAENGGN